MQAITYCTFALNHVERSQRLSRIKNVHNNQQKEILFKSLGYFQPISKLNGTAKTASKGINV